MLQKGGEVYKGNIASLSIIMALADAVKIKKKLFHVLIRPGLRILMRVFFSVCFVLWFLLCFALFLRCFYIVAVCSEVLSCHSPHHSTNNCTQLPEHQTHVSKQFLPAFFQISSGTYPDAGLWRNSRCASMKMTGEGGEKGRLPSVMPRPDAEPSKQLLLLASLQKCNFKRLNVSLQENVQK